MELLSVTRSVLDQVHALTGLPVEIIEDPDLAVTATGTTARRGMPAHIFRVRRGEEAPDYRIVYQCGFILRLYAAPAEARFEYASSEEASAVVQRLLRELSATGQVRLPAQVLPQYAAQLRDGLITQLRSYPVGMRVDSWIHATFPDLRALQAASFAGQQRGNAQSLSPQAKRLTPRLIYQANATMNAAFALFCDELLARALYGVPFRSAGLEGKGRDLLAVLRRTPDDPDQDPALIDAWAGLLKLEGWYERVPFIAAVP